MTRTTDKERIDKRLAESMTVGKMIKQLGKYPADTPVGRVGHFGEALLMDGVGAIHLVSRAYITPTGSWRDDNQRQISMIELYVPSWGPDPD